MLLAELSCRQTECTLQGVSLRNVEHDPRLKNVQNCGPNQG